MSADSLLSMVDQYAAPLPGADHVRSGYRILRDLLGEGIFDLSTPLALWASNLVPESLAEHSALGHLLLALSDGEDGRRILRHLRSRLRSRSEIEVRGVLAEMHALAGLQSRQPSVRLIQTTTGHGASADIQLGAGLATEVEVSYLGPPETWELSQILRLHLEHGLAPIVIEHRLFIDVSCVGLAKDLLEQVGEAIAELHARLDRPRPWQEELKPGMTFEVLDSLACRAQVHGATIYRSDPLASESVLVRIPNKMWREARQVRPGGVVLILTSQLSSLFNPIRSAEEPPELLVSLVDRIQAIGSRRANVSVFAVLDQIGLAESPPPLRVPVGGAELSQAMKGSTFQRLLWVPNPRALVPGPPHLRNLFTPPF